ncbi:MAG: FecR family protein [Treponema sp.]|jgi:hypothetical protein|nr:FecR family protein [Treponema sp.]
MNRGKPFFICALALMGAFSFVPRFSPPLYAQETAFFREVNGTVEIKAPGSELWINASPGDRIEKNTLVSTGFRSSAAIVLGESLIMVRPLTRLSLDEIITSQNNEEVNIYLHTGRLRAEVSPPAGGKIDFTVRSPIVTASVRGTSFEFDTENLRVDEGRVQYSLANGRQVAVTGGGISYVDETANTVISPFEAAEELLAPALPPGGSASGSPAGDSAPLIPPPSPPSEPSGADVEIGFGWD